MNSLPCDVVLLPVAELASKAVEISNILTRHYNSYFTLEDGKFFPHASLYMLQLNDSKLEEVESLLTQIASRNKHLSLSATSYCQKLGYIDVQYEVATELATLQNQVIEALNPVRDGMREKDKARMLEATGLALENFQNYGYKYIGDLFRPHITFTRFNETQAEAESVLPPVSSFNGDFPKIGLFEMGDNGTCIRKIAEFDLKIQ